jgi:hypothetical protein
VDINSLNPFDGLTFDQLKRLEAILQKKITAMRMRDLNAISDDAAETAEQGKEKL